MSTTPAGLSWPVVGRQRELAQIADLLGRADLSGIVLAGESGVGKSRLVEHCLEIGGKIGFSTQRVIATRAASAIPLGALAALTTATEATVPSANALGQAIDALRALGADRPLLLAVDDAHLLDEASAVVVHQAVVTTGAFVVATLRTGETAPDPITALWKEGLAERIDLDPLTVDDVAQLVTTVVAGSVDRATVRMLFDVSEGNPLYLRELIIGALDAGHLSEEGGVWRLTTITRTPRLIELVEARLTDLDADARRVLEYLSFGEPLALSDLQRLAEPDVLGRLDEKALLRIDTASTAHEVRLAHPLHGEVLQAGVSPLQGMAIRRRLADLFTDPGPLLPADVLRVALWYLDSVGPVDAELALEAARMAQRSHAPALAERLARAALEAGPSIAAAVAVAESLLAQGRVTEAAELTAGPAFDGVTDEWRVRATSVRARALFWCGDGTGALDAVDATLADAEGPAHDQLVARRASFMMLLGDPAGALAATESLLDSEDSRIRNEAADVAGPAMVLTGRIEDGIAAADIGVDAMRGLGDEPEPGDAAPHLVARALGLSEAGRIDEALDATEVGYDTTIEQRSLEGQAWFAFLRGRVQHLAGHLAVAADAFAEGGVRFGDLQRSGLRAWCLAQQARCRAELGDPEAASELLEVPSPDDHLGLMEPDLHRARAWVSVARGELDAARGHLELACETGAARQVWTLALGAAHDLARIGEVDASHQRMQQIGPRVDGELAAVRRAVVDALVAGDPAAIEEAATRFEELGTLLLAAETFATSAAEYRRAGERRRADGVALRCRSLLDAAGGARTPALRLAGEATASLTRRELEIAELAARGLSNPEIAEQLVVSVRTVANQLQRAYTKLGINARGDLAEALDRLR